MNLDKYVSLTAFQNAMKALDYTDQEYIVRHILRSCKSQPQLSRPQPLTRTVVDADTGASRVVDAKEFHTAHQQAASNGLVRHVSTRFQGGRAVKYMTLRKTG